MLLALFASFLLGLLAPVTSGGGQRMRAQLIGIAPSEGICRRKLQWVRLEWSNNTVEGVTLVDADLGSQGISATLGALSDIQFPPETPEKTCRLDPSGERLVCLGRVRESTPRDVGPAGLGGWCCADSLIIFSKDGSPQQIVDVQTPLRQALLSNGDLGAEEIASVNPSHSLELEPSSSAGRLTVLVMFEYDSLALSATDDQGNTVPVPDYGVAMFELDLNAGNVRVVPLANGAAAFLAFPNVGTLSNATLDTVYKVSSSTEPAPSGPARNCDLCCSSRPSEPRRPLDLFVGCAGPVRNPGLRAAGSDHGC